ncbi:hypothetical protein BpHYR1_045827 [Brachionus plicatilis]|uniref:Uncharacterized protein n=1 Tax=Brachionus plicatilis TaxID=10195 RepID=A0A3M7RR81_BRAPC|nr:hypothetical protein BpHYR1_045827 [Brachionus plicatilis]
MSLIFQTECSIHLSSDNSIQSGLTQRFLIARWWSLCFTECRPCLIHLGRNCRYVNTRPVQMNPGIRLTTKSPASHTPEACSGTQINYEDTAQKDYG